MPSLNGTEVRIGDLVYDVTNSSGKVTALTDKTIEVLFKNGRRISFNEHGQLDGVRRLFWHYPIFIDPPKDKVEWEKTLDAVKAIFNIVNSHR